MVAEDQAGGAQVPADDGVVGTQRAFDEERQLRMADILFQFRKGRLFHGLPDDHGILRVLHVHGVLHVHADGQGAVLLRVFQAAEDLLFLRVGLDDLHHLRAGGQDIPQFLVAAHADADAGAGLFRAFRHGDQIQVAERSGHDRRLKGLPQETEGRVRPGRPDSPALHEQGIHIYPCDLHGIAFCFPDHDTPPVILSSAPRRDPCGWRCGKE